MIYLKLFLSFVQIGLFTIGGGYAAIPLIQNQAVEKNGWITLAEFTDLITIAEMTPGPIAINTATFVGIQIGGFRGALVATIGCIFPSLIIVNLIAYFYFKYKDIKLIKEILKSIRPAVIGLIGSAGLTIILLTFFNGKEISINTLKILPIIIFIFGIFLIRKVKVNPILTIAICGILNLFLKLIFSIEL